MHFSIITLFPEVFMSVFSSSLLGRARRDKTVDIDFVNLRDFGQGRHKIVDDKPYGGGVGMILRVDVLDRAISTTKTGVGREAVILLDPKGQVFKQKTAETLVAFDHLIFVCGRYEGFDERIRSLVDYEISIGDYVLSGGEIPTMVIIEAISRLIPGFLEKCEATDIESFSESANGRILEAPCYTRPPLHKGRRVPTVLLSGDFDRINKYRTRQAVKITKTRRPDLV